MPGIFKFKCNKCDFAFPEGWGHIIYVKDENGNKITCAHPGEEYDIAKVLKIDTKKVSDWLMSRAFEARKKFDWKKGFEGYYDNILSENNEINKLIIERTGLFYDCVCSDCLQQFGLDIKKEERKCPKCGSVNVKTAREMINQNCPKCKEGTILEVDTGKVT